jgi:uncharacterized membrane protein YhfC
LDALVQPSPLLLLSGLGMMLIGLAPVLYLRRRCAVSWKVFGLGAVAWLSATIVKAAMDILITPSLSSAFQGASTLESAITLGLYVGLRTGIFEAGFTLIWARRFQLFSASFEDAVAFGAGFACVEALALGLNSFLGILEILMNPGVLGTLDPALQQALSAQYAIGPALIGVPIIERTSSLFIHCFSVVMVFMAMRGARGLLPIAALYASLADMTIPLLNMQASSMNLTGAYMLEAPYIILGLVGLFGLMRSRTDPIFAEFPHRGKPHAR